MKANMGTVDRVLRTLVAAGIAYLPFGLSTRKAKGA